MESLLEWIRAAETVRPTCQNRKEFDELIETQRRRLVALRNESEQSMANQTADDFKTKNVEKMGEKLGSQFSALWQETAVLHLNWKEYVELFGTSPERVAMLNRAAPMFFHMVQNELWEATLLHIARLTDSPRSAGRENLTILNLPELIKDGVEKARVEKLIETARKATEFCRDWRNRHIAHRDLSLAINDPTTELAAANKMKVYEALKSVADVLNAVQGHYLDAYTPFDFASRHASAVTLLHLIYRGLKANEAREARLNKGEYSGDDLDPVL